MLLLAIVGAVVFHPVLLRQIAQGLIVDDSHEPARFLAILGGDRCFAYGAQHYAAANLDGILLLQDPESRLEQKEIVATRSEMGQRELERLGVPAEKTVTLRFTSHDEWAWARRLRDWMREQPGRAEHPERTVAVVCDRLESGHVSRVLDQTLPRQERGAVVIHPLRDRRYDEANWWKSRTGIKKVGALLLDYGYFALRGEDRRAAPAWDPDVYERLLAP